MTTSSSWSDELYTRIPAAELRTWGPFVRKDAVKAGDVLLTRGRGGESFVIALMTGGRYSHAAIFLPFRIDTAAYEGGTITFNEAYLDLVEADDHGVGTVPPRTLWIVFGDRRHHVIRLPGERAAKAAVLLRHPAIKSVDESTLEKAVHAFNDAELLRRYSSLDRLAGPLPLPRAVRGVIGRALSAAFPEPKGLVLSGCFCSELVVKFFANLGIPVVATTVVPETISPNHLVPSRSLLKIVPDAIFTPADIPDDAHGEILGVQTDLRPRYLPGLVSDRENTELRFPEMQKKAEDLKKEAEDFAAAMKKWADTLRGNLRDKR